LPFKVISGSIKVVDFGTNGSAYATY